MAPIDPIAALWRSEAPLDNQFVSSGQAVGSASLMNFSIVGWLSALSLIEPLVALAWQVAFARAAGFSLPWSRHALLFLSLWLVYSADHWLDARRTPPHTFQTCRHRFAATYQKSLLATWCVALVGSLALASCVLRPREWTAGLVLIASTLAYLVLVHRFRRGLGFRAFAKAVWVAGLFAAGSSLFIWANQPLAPQLWVAVGLFFLLAWLNLTVIAERERSIDCTHGTTSIAHCIRHIDRLSRALAATVVSSATFAWFTWPDHGALFGSLATCAFALVLHRRWSQQLQHERAHVISDVILLLPAGPCLLGWIG